MLMGLLPPSTDAKDTMERAIDMKMSKSNPDSAIFMTDSEEDVKRKLKKAYCPEGQVNENPVLEYCRYILFEKFRELKAERPAKFGGDVSFGSYDELEKAFAQKKIHPLDMKSMTARYVNQLVEPVRKHFETSKKAKELKELVEGFKVTR
jgi:tyrosyl-tRNA synthetase